MCVSENAIPDEGMWVVRHGSWQAWILKPFSKTSACSLPGEIRPAACKLLSSPFLNRIGKPHVLWLTLGLSSSKSLLGTTPAYVDSCWSVMVQPKPE